MRTASSEVDDDPIRSPGAWIGFTILCESDVASCGYPLTPAGGCAPGRIKCILLDRQPWPSVDVQLKEPRTDHDDLLERARRLDAHALGQVHDRYFAEVYRYIRFRLDNEQQCEDLSAEVFLRLINALHRQKGPSINLRAWLLGTASNLVNDHLRRRYRRKEENLDASLEESLVGESSPDSAWETAWQQDEIRRALQRLTTEQQHVIALRFADERSLDETAQIIGKTVSAVKALQFRALASLRKFLDEEKLDD